MTNTTTDNSILFFTRLHWVIFFWPVLFFVISLGLGIYIPQLETASLIMSGFAFLWILMTWVTYYFSSITIKKRQVILRTGIIIRQTVDISVNKIESIDIRQSILGSIFRYGTLIITGTGGTKQLVNYLDKPLTCRRYIEQLINEQ